MLRPMRPYLLTACLPFLVVATGAASESGGAVRNLKQGWTQELLYENSLVSPGSLTVTDAGDLLVLDAALMKVKRLALDGALPEYADLGALPNAPLAIAYQEQHARLLVITDTGELYEHSHGNLSPLGTTALPARAVAVDSRDDSLYAAAPTDAGPFLNHYDSNGTYLSTITSDFREISQLALDQTFNKLYYSEPFAGQIVEIDLNTNSSRVIADGIGIPGTPEAISVMLDGTGDLYFYTADQGLNKYETGAFRKVMDALSGAGPLTWAPLFGAFVQAHFAGGNIVSYDPLALEFAVLTQGLNAHAIVEMDSGVVLVCSEEVGNNVLQIGEGGLAVFSEPLPSRCMALERDDHGRVYAGLENGEIVTVAADGTTTAWGDVSSGTPLFTIHYDSQDSAIVAMTRDVGENVSRVWRTNLDNPTVTEQVIELAGTAAIAGAVDDQGNVYVLDWNSNAIYKIAGGSDPAVVLASNVLDSMAITGPGMEYLATEDALVVSTILSYELWPIVAPSKSLLAENNGGVDNFSINETDDYGLICIHSGRVFRLSPDEDGDGLPDNRDACPQENATNFDADGDGCIDTVSGLADLVADLVEQGIVAEQLANSLLRKVENAERSADRQNVCAATHLLEALVNAVEAQRGKKITADAAEMIIGYVDSLIRWLQSQPGGGEGC